MFLYVCLHSLLTLDEVKYLDIIILLFTDCEITVEKYLYPSCEG